LKTSGSCGHAASGEGRAFHVIYPEAVSGGTLSHEGEQALIDRIVRGLGGNGRRLRGCALGPGDDAAVLSAARGMQWVVSCDWFLEQTHFLSRVHPPEVVGYKALARAASDLAAMGATPRFFLLALAVPESRTGKWLGEVLAGMARAARRLGLSLVGGDTSARGAAGLCLTVIGEVPSGQAVTRRGARPGDKLFVSGALGQAQLGLEVVLRGRWRQPSRQPLLQRHFYPQPRIELGRWLAQNQLAAAMIDLSDGFSSDLHNLCRASGVGARIISEQIPQVAVARTMGLRLDPLQLALHGGEDYELLFAVRAGHAHRIPAKFKGLPLTAVGEVTKSRAIRLVEPDGRAARLAARGWDPFRR